MTIVGLAWCEDSQEFDLRASVTMLLNMEAFKHDGFVIETSAKDQCFGPHDWFPVESEVNGATGELALAPHHISPAVEPLDGTKPDVI